MHRLYNTKTYNHFPYFVSVNSGSAPLPMLSCPLFASYFGWNQEKMGISCTKQSKLMTFWGSCMAPLKNVLPSLFPKFFFGAGATTECEGYSNCITKMVWSQGLGKSFFFSGTPCISHCTILSIVNFITCLMVRYPSFAQRYIICIFIRW